VENCTFVKSCFAKASLNTKPISAPLPLSDRLLGLVRPNNLLRGAWSFRRRQERQGFYRFWMIKEVSFEMAAELPFGLYSSQVVANQFVILLNQTNALV
jgi:hypothetical protein